MIWLQSNDKYDELIEYDHSTGKFQVISRGTLPQSTAIRTEGFCATLSTVFIALYRFGQQLFLRVGETCTSLTDDVVVFVGGSPNNRYLIVDKAGKEIARLDYSLDIAKRFPDDVTPFCEDEDFDFGLFISNISKSSKRKRVLLGLE